MATGSFKMPEDFLMKISTLNERTDDIVPRVLEAGSKVMLAKVRGNLASVVGNSTKYESRSQGELSDSLGVSDARLDREGNHNVKVGFNEPRRVQYAAKRKRSYKEITNAMIANVIEYGKHGQPPKPFLKRAKASAKGPCIEAMKAKLEEEMESI